MSGSSREPARVLVLLVAGALALAFGTPLRALWAAEGAPFWLAYAVWAAAILVLAMIARSRRR